MADIELYACPVDDEGGPLLPELPNVIYVSSAYVTRPTRPDINLLQEPPVVRMNGTCVARASNSQPASQSIG